MGGKVEHDCNLERGIGYFLEPMIQLAPFCKHPMHLILRGVTNNQIDPSPDLLRLSALPVLKRFVFNLPSKVEALNFLEAKAENYDLHKDQIICGFYFQMYYVYQVSAQVHFRI